MAVISHTGYNKFIHGACDYPWLFNTITFYYTISMFVLFSNFYYWTYVASRRQTAARRQLLAKEEKYEKPPTMASDLDDGDAGSYRNGFALGKGVAAVNGRSDGRSDGQGDDSQPRLRHTAEKRANSHHTVM